MATPHRKLAAQHPPDIPVVPVAQWAWLSFQPFLEAQRLQWDAFLCWQQSIATFNKDLWDQWAVRWAGGVPIDG